MAAGCITVGTPTENQMPTAYIDSIKPDKVSIGEAVAFDGHGTDPDGTIVAYRWRSSIDGQLSTKASFENSSLSKGEHIIYLKVQDNNGEWSAEVRRTVTVLTEATSNGTPSLPVISSFDANPGNITSGGSSTLSWEVSGATTASIDAGIGSVALSGTRVVSPGATTTYTLTATNEAGNATATAQVIVSAAPPPAGLPVINAFTANPGTIIAGNSSILSWNVSNANVVTIDHGVGVVASTGNASVSPVTTTSYTLTATNASGWSNVTIQVVVNPALPPPIAMVEVFPVIAESGYVRSNGNPWPNYIYVGDDNNDISIQGFISFDISAIPAGATITNVKVDFTNYASAMGDPFGSLGTLRFYAHNYGVLDGSDYYAGPPPAGYILYYNSAGSIAVHDAPLVKNALQAKVGSSRFQMRLQFNVATDSNGDNDIMRWMTSYVPKLIVTFTVP